MRRTVRGHHVVFEGIGVRMPKPGQILYFLQAYCDVCGTAWTEDVSPETRRRILGPGTRRTVADVVSIAISRTPACEDAYREMVAHAVIES